jgi:hypothetical protein
MRSLAGFTAAAGVAFAMCLSISDAAGAQAAPMPAPAKPAQPTRPSAARPADGSIELPSFGTEQAPTEAQLGVPIYPTAQFLQSYDGGRGQRIYLFGATASFPDLVSYYRTVLGTKGDLVFERPATQFFEAGRFREGDVSFTPGVTIKDFTGFGSEGYPNPNPGGDPARFPTVIQIVPAPSAAAR